MKAAAFDYLRPGSVAEAVKALSGAAKEGRFAKVLAGGQSLGPMLNLRLARPELLIDISKLAELCEGRDDGDSVRLGAAVTHAAIEDGRVPDPTGGALRAVARGIAYRAVRNRGTIGGSLAHADPAADWISTLAALDATVEVQGPRGSRIVKVGGLMSGAFATGLDEAEIVTAVRIPKPSADARWGFYKINRKTGEYAHAIGVVLADPERGVCRAVVGAVEAPPIVIDDAAERLFGGRIADGALIDRYDEAAAAAVVDGTELGRDPYERRIHLVALRRAVQLAEVPR